jgi:tetratricopeptide (TPR) repeat protein
MRYSSFITFLLFSSFLLPANNREISPAELIVQDGINAMYNYEFENAITILDSAWQIDSTHPVPPFVLIAAKWLHTQIREGYDASYEKIDSEVEATLPIYKSLIAQYPENPEYYLYLGSTYGIRARTALAGKAWLDVLYFGYQGLKYIRKAQDMDSELKDVYMPLGLMEYFACLSAAPVQWGAKLIGLSTDCVVGITHLEIAAKESHYSWIEASNVLTYVYLHIKRDFTKAEQIITPLVEQFPGHPYFAFLRGELLAKTQKWDELDELMPKLREFASKGSFLQQNECQLKLAYIEGVTAYYKKDYTNAISKFNWILSNYHMEFDWLKGFTHFLRGQTHEEIGEFGLAVADYEEVLKMDSYYPEVDKAQARIREMEKRK